MTFSQRMDQLQKEFSALMHENLAELQVPANDPVRGGAVLYGERLSVQVSSVALAQVVAGLEALGVA